MHVIAKAIEKSIYNFLNICKLLLKIVFLMVIFLFVFTLLGMQIFDGQFPEDLHSEYRNYYSNV